MTIRFLTAVLAVFSFFSAQSATISGKITSDTGESLAFATIYVKNTQTGTTSNADGEYEISLTPGEYQLVFQYIGFESVIKKVTVASENIKLNVQLKTQTMVLQDIEVYAGKEDPAYTIMRKAIAKAKFHTQQIDKYKATVYMKGKGQLTDAPFWAKKMLENEGVEEGRVFVSESVSEVEYIRPNTYNEKVISIYTVGDDNNSSPNAYINGSFYEPELAKSISPLSPKAFSYYRFEYQGTFKDEGYEISKINVIPRSKGDNVFEGYIQIVEDYWSIHSLELKVTKLGIKFDIRQIYKPIEDKAWLPVTHDFEVNGKVFGFGFTGEYLATASDYSIELNPDLDINIEVIDEKVEKELASELKDQFKNEEISEVQEILTSGKEVTRKQLKKVIKAYEKAELDELDEPDVIENRTYKVDSLATKRDSAYWAAIRPVPLTEKEKRGYQITDSLAQVEKAKSEGDTLRTKRNRSGFKPYHLLLGGNYKVGEKAYFEIHFPNIQYNTVEGYNIDYRLSMRKTFENGNYLRFGPTARYAFAREKFSGIFSTYYGFGEREKRNDLDVEFGRYINQFNNDEPIHPMINTFMSLFLERNYMKIYEKDFVSVNYRKKITTKFNFSVNLQIADRRELFNNTSYKFIDRSGEGFTPNAPAFMDINIPSFPEHRAVTAELKLYYKPWQKYRISNGKKYTVDTPSPRFELNYKKGIADVLDSEVDFDQVELGITQNFKIGIRGIVDYKIKAGTFLNNDKMYFMDLKHFPGNQTPLVTADPVGSFRLLDYYKYSTSEEYLQASLHYQFRKFLVTRIPIVRLAGVRESVFTNYLANDLTNDYVEVGYGINYIFRVFRVEAVSSFEGGEFRDFGVRIGIATNLDNIF